LDKQKLKNSEQVRFNARLGIRLRGLQATGSEIQGLFEIKSRISLPSKGQRKTKALPQKAYEGNVLLARFSVEYQQPMIVTDLGRVMVVLKYLT
jgi:hypothetical protein